MKLKRYFVCLKHINYQRSFKFVCLKIFSFGRFRKLIFDLFNRKWINHYIKEVFYIKIMRLKVEDSYKILFIVSPNSISLNVNNLKSFFLYLGYKVFSIVCHLFKIEFFVLFNRRKLLPNLKYSLAIPRPVQLLLCNSRAPS